MKNNPLLLLAMLAQITFGQTTYGQTVQESIEKLRDNANAIESVVNGPATGAGSSVALPGGGTQDTLAKMSLQFDPATGLRVDTSQSLTQAQKDQLAANWPEAVAGFTPTTKHFLHTFDVANQNDGSEVPNSNSGHTILSAGAGNLSGQSYPGQIAVKIENGRLSLDDGGNHYWVPRLNGVGSGLGFVPRFIGAELVWEDETGSANSVAVFLVGRQDAHPTVPMIHFTITNEGWNCERWTRNVDDTANIIDVLGSYSYPTALTFDKSHKVMIELATERNQVVVYVTGHAPRAVNFPNLTDFATQFVSYQITESRVASGQPLPTRRTFYESMFALERLPSQNSEAEAISAIEGAVWDSRKSGEAVVTPPPPKILELTAFNNGATIAPDIDRVEVNIPDSTWNNSFFTMYLPDPSTVPLNHEIEFVDTAGTMDPSNVNGEFINLAPAGSWTHSNPQHGSSQRFLGQVPFVVRAISSTQWQLNP